MSVWGVLLTSSDSALGLQSTCAPLRGCCDEVVVVSHHSGNGYQGPNSYAGTRLGHFIAALRRVPDRVPVIVFVDDADTDTADLDAVAEMLDRFDDDMAALVRGVPVTDALKQVEGDRVLGSRDRTGLFVPGTPQILRRDAFERALEESAGGDDEDPATLMARRGLRVGVETASRAVVRGPGEGLPTNGNHPRVGN